MVRKPNYDFDKRRKEQDRKAKKDAKRADRQQRREQGLPEDGAEPESPSTPPGEQQPGNVPLTE
jgi:hypothetical protein